MRHEKNEVKDFKIKGINAVSAIYTISFKLD